MVKEGIKVLREIYFNDGISTPELMKKTGKKRQTLWTICYRLESRVLVKKVKTQKIISGNYTVPMLRFYINKNHKDRVIKLLKEAYPDEFNDTIPKFEAENKIFE